MPTVLFSRLYPDVQLPARATDGAAGWDLAAYVQPDPDGRTRSILLSVGETKAIPTGLLYQGGAPIFVCSRSGLAIQRSIFVLNAPGVIDHDFRGEIRVILHNAGRSHYRIAHGDRIAQAVFFAGTPVHLEWGTGEATLRGTKGYGSTGV